MSKFGALELAVDQPFRMVIVDPVSRQPVRMKDNPEEVAYIDHYSADSDIARKHQRAVARKRLAMRGRGKISPEELEAEAVELLAMLSTGWNLIARDGTKIDVPFSQENARELYANAAVSWIREQLDESAADRGNFSKGSSTS